MISHRRCPHRGTRVIPQLIHPAIQIVARPALAQHWSCTPSRCKRRMCEGVSGQTQVVTEDAGPAGTRCMDPTVRQQLLQAELQPGERLVWDGSPDTRKWFVASDRLLVPFSLMWGGFAIFWEASVLTDTATGGGHRYGIIFQLWGVPFVLIGLYAIAGRLIARHCIGARTIYGLTDRRGLTITPLWRGGRNLSSIRLDSLPPVAEQIARDGHGTILIGPVPPGIRTFAGDPGWPSGTRAGNVVAFWNIRDARQVGTLAQRLISSARVPERGPQA
jgi:hypothetical protein